jgi:hypothetical protein
MNHTNQRAVAAVIFVIIVCVAGVFVWQRFRETAGPGAIAAPLATTTHDQLGAADERTPSVTVVKMAGTGEYKTELVPIAPTVTAKIPVPDFKTPLSCTLAADACAAIKTKTDVVVGKLSANTTDLSAWITLGTLRKMTGDYQGAATVWEYAAKLYPSHPTAFTNLGDLYMSYLHDNAKAEVNYLTAIKNFPQGTDAYRALAELYGSGFRGGSAEEDILKKGIQAVPQAIDLQVLLARYYTSAGRTSDAAMTYDAAITAAHKAGNTSLAASLEAEKAGK